MSRTGLISSRRVGFVAVIAGIIACLGIALRTSRPRLPAPTRIWSIDLYEDGDFRKRQATKEVFLNTPHVNFISDSQIICDFYGGETIGYNPSLAPSDYHVVEIDVGNGKLGRRLNLQSVDDHSRALPGADHGFVVLAGGYLTKLDSQFVAETKYPTPIESPNQRPDLWLMDVAPDGQSLLLYFHRTGDSQGVWTWFRTRDLVIAKKVSGPLINLATASSTSGIVAPRGRGNSVFSGERVFEVCPDCDAYFITNDLLFLASEHSYAIQTIGGKRLGSGTLDVWAGDFARSANTTRFAYSTGHYNGSGFPIQSHFDSVSSRSVVVDWRTNTAIAEVDTDEPANKPSAGLSQMAMALSPDGTRLAILLHHTLTLYRLP